MFRMSGESKTIVLVRIVIHKYCKVTSLLSKVEILYSPRNCSVRRIKTRHK